MRLRATVSINEAGRVERRRSRRRAAGAWLLFALVLSPAARAAETAEAVIAELGAHGFDSPLLALERLRAATPPEPTAPLAQRWRYQAELADIALMAYDPVPAQAALASLQSMVDRERCAPCGVVQALLRTQLAQTGDAATLRARMDELGALPEPADPWLRFQRHLTMGNARLTLNDAEGGLADALKAAESGAALGRPADLVAALELVGVVNATRRDTPHAVTNMRQAVSLSREIGFRYGLVRGLFNLSYALSPDKQTNRERKALLDEVLQLTEATRGLERMRQYCLNNLAALSNDMGDHAGAIAYATQVEAAARLAGDTSGLAFGLVNHGVALVKLGRVDEGLALVQTAIGLGEKVGDKRELADLLEQQVDALESAGRWQAALRTLHRQVGLNTELTNSQREQAIAQLQERVAAQQRLREIERLTLEKARGDTELQLHAWRERAWAGAALLVALLGVLAWRGLRRSRDLNRHLRRDVERLADESLHDALTGVWNRRYGELLLERLEAQAARQPAGERRGVALLLMDIDRFKSVNDTFGHAAGDAVLVELARRAQAILRGGDAIVRWGGEEFLLIFPGAEGAALQAIGERLLVAIGAQPVPLPQERGLAIRVSAGAVTWAAGNGRPWADELALADAALYRAKATGRNRMLTASPRRPLDAAEIERLDDLLADGLLRLETVAGPPLPAPQ